MLDWLIPAAYAQAAAPAVAGKMDTFFGPVMIFIMMGVFYFVIIRPQSKRAKEAREMVGKLAKGDEVLITGGLAGKVVSVGEAYLTLEIADGVQVKVQKSAVGSVLPKGSLKNL